MLAPIRPFAPEEDPAEQACVSRETVEWVRHAYRSHSESVLRSLRRLGVPESKIEDALQEVFIVVHRRSSDFTGSSSLRTWVLGITVRVAANARRGARRDQRFVELVDEPLSPGKTPEEHAEQRQAAQIVHALLSSLAPEQREIFVLVDFEGLSVTDAARALDEKVSTCYKRLSAARSEFNAHALRFRTIDRRRFT